MQNRYISILIISIMTLFLVAPCVLSEEPISLEEQIIELRKQMSEMQKQHEAEINTLRQEVQELKEIKGIAVKEEEEIESLRRLAESEAAKEKDEEEAEEVVFKHGGLALQKLNPEISVTGDIINTYAVDRDNDRFDFNFRNLGIHLESYMDPYTRFKAAVPVTTSSAKIGEAYFTRYGILKDVNLTMGKFRQQFGVVNRWHKHGLDQVDFPLALRQIFGDGGLNQIGASLEWAMPPLGDSSQELIVQVTNGENDRLFSGDTISVPSILTHYKNHRDISKDTYMELGLSSLLGWNREWDIRSGAAIVNEKVYRHVAVFGADLTVLWEPTDYMRYRNLEWRNELYWLNKSISAPDGSGRDALNAWGAYSYLQGKVTRTLDIGARVDFYKPDDKDYADMSGLSLAPLAYVEDTYQWQVSPYITWWQSPFVKFRLEYDHLDGKSLSEPEDRIMLQAIFAVGPHKHERY